MHFPEELFYHPEHTWARIEDDTATVGITDHAQEQLGAISAVELPQVGDDLEQDDSFGSIEARKTVADLYAPFSGPVLEVNEELQVSPELVNDDPYDGGWLVTVGVNDAEELNSLMSAEDYMDYVEEDQD